MTTDTETLLRDKLKVALQDAKKLFDDGLIDEKEFKDLKTHELSKYKEQLAAITASAISRAIDKTPSNTHQPNADVTPIHTPLNTRQIRDASRPSPGSAPSSSSPPTLLRRRAAPELMYVDSNTFKRLTTPPIFRRRSAKKRKIVVQSTELRALQELAPDNIMDVRLSPSPENINVAASRT